MKLLPRLIKKRILVAFGREVKGDRQVQDGMKEVNAEVWEDVGLAIHEYNDDIERGKWRITHIESGKSILRYMERRSEAIQYMVLIRVWKSAEGIQPDWGMTDVQFQKLHYREEIVGMLLGLQKEISGVVR